MKRRDVLSGVALIGLMPAINKGGNLKYRPNVAMTRHGLDISDYRARIFQNWAVDAARGHSARTLLGDVHADFLVTRSLTLRANDRARQLEGYRVMAWQGVLLTTLYTRLGDISQARQAAKVAREFGYQGGDRAAVASAYDRESIAEIWYGTPELGVTAATRGIRVIQSESATHHGPILAGLHSQAMVHYARSPEYIELSRGYERRVLDWQQRLPETRVPSAFELTPSQMYNSLAIAHAFRQQPDASELFAAGFQATGYAAKERAAFRKLVRLNQAWAEASRDPRRALEIACDVMRSFGSDTASADPIYRDRATRTIRAVPKSVPPQWTAELRHLVGQPHR